MTSSAPVLEVCGVSKSFTVEASFIAALKKRMQGKSCETLQALNNLNFRVMSGETLGILGESGSGKSTLARVLMGIYDAEAGSAKLLGDEVIGASGAARLKILKNMQMVFQDPFGSLDPRMTVRKIVAEPLKIHRIVPAEGMDAFLQKALCEVGLTSDALERYPSEFSGGQRQRIGICRALALSPKLIIADEAVSALDVSVQAQILELLVRLRRERQLSMIFISHDVAVVRQIADRILLLYRGNLVEELPADKLIDGSVHPYTKKLLAAALFLREGQPIAPQPENGRSALKFPAGCCYRSTCPDVFADCQEIPPMREISPGHRVACWKKL
jgi:oligopeptide/dipeptide ABC transporter ATP-binding protein